MLADETNNYLYGVGRLAQYDTAMQYFGADGLGSVRQIYNNAAVVRRNTLYDPFGNVLTTNGTSASVYGFTGEQADITGLVYLRARYYAPGQGRFTTKDTWEGYSAVPQTLNQFNYVTNNPIRFTDPSGHDGPIPPSAIPWQHLVNTGQLTAPAAAALAAACLAGVCEVVIVGGILIVTAGTMLYIFQIDYPDKYPPPQPAPAPRDVPFTGDPKVFERRLAQQQAEPAPNAQRAPAPEPAPEPRTDPYVPPLSIPTCTPESKPEFIYRKGHRVKDLSLHRQRDWETGLSFYDSPPLPESYLKFRVVILQANGYVVRSDGGTLVEKLWGLGPVLDPRTDS